MAGSSRFSVNDILQHLGNDELDCGMVDGSDDGLGMDSDYVYDLDSSVELRYYSLCIVMCSTENKTTQTWITVHHQELTNYLQCPAHVVGT